MLSSDATGAALAPARLHTGMLTEPHGQALLAAQRLQFHAGDLRRRVWPLHEQERLLADQTLLFLQPATAGLRINNPNVSAYVCKRTKVNTEQTAACPHDKYATFAARS